MPSRNEYDKMSSATPRPDSELDEMLFELESHFAVPASTAKEAHERAIAAIAARDRRLELAAKIDEAQKIYTNYVPSGTLVGKAVLKRIRRYKAELDALGSTERRQDGDSK